MAQAKTTTLRYVGNADSRGFTSEDFSRHDISGQDDVTFDASNNFVAEVSADAADYLLTNHGDEFVDSAAPVEETDDTAADSAGNAPSGGETA